MTLAQLLHALAEALDELPTTAAGLTGTRRTGTIARVGHSPGIHVHAVDPVVWGCNHETEDGICRREACDGDTAWTVRNTLTTWARVLVEDEELRIPAGVDAADSAALARWMASVADRLDGHMAAEEAREELCATLRAVQRVVQARVANRAVVASEVASRLAEAHDQWRPLPWFTRSNLRLLIPTGWLPADRTIRSWAEGTPRKPALLLLQGGAVRVGSVVEIIEQRHAKGAGT